MNFDRVMRDAFDLMEKSISAKQKKAALESARWEKIGMEQERTKRMGFSSQERIQNLINQGLLDKQTLVNQGLMDLEQLKQSGLTDRQKTTEEGLDRRQSRGFNFKRTMPVFKEHKNKTVDQYGIETEASEWKNVNTAAARAHGDPGGGTWDDSERDFLTKSSNGPPNGNSVATPPRRIETDQVDTQRINSRTPLESLPRGTGYLQTEGGRRLNVRGNNITEVSEDRVMPTRTHQLTDPPSSQSPAANRSLAPYGIQEPQSAAPISRTLHPNAMGSVLPGANGQTLLRAPVKDRMTHFKRTLNTAQDDQAFKEWFSSGPNYNRKMTIDRMKNKKTPDWRRY